MSLVFVFLNSLTSVFLIVFLNFIFNYLVLNLGPVMFFSCMAVSIFMMMSLGFMSFIYMVVFVFLVNLMSFLMNLAILYLTFCMTFYSFYFNRI